MGSPLFPIRLTKAKKNELTKKAHNAGFRSLAAFLIAAADSYGVTEEKQNKEPTLADVKKMLFNKHGAEIATAWLNAYGDNLEALKKLL